MRITGFIVLKTLPNFIILTGSFCFMCLSACDNTASLPQPNTSSRRESVFDKTIAALNTADDPEELKRLGRLLVNSRESQAYDASMSLLQDPNYWKRLDPDGDHLPPEDLRLGEVLKVVAQLPSEKANKAVLTLAENKQFISSNAREWALFRACEEIREPSPKLLDFLDSQMNSPTGSPNTAIRTLIRMRSTSACDRIEKHFQKKEFSVGKKTGCFVFQFIFVRNDLAIVKFYEKVLRSDVKDDSLRNVIIQTLFDYRPKDKDWCPYPEPDTVDPFWVPPPPRREASTETLEKILVIADFSVKLKINEKTRESIEKGRKEIERILDYRKNHESKIPGLLKDLASANFQIRDQAARELERFADLAEPELRQALQDNLPLEARRRLEQILEKLRKVLK